jgi:dTDP-4-amino-4,6-dideoxygalactose transaminase
LDSYAASRNRAADHYDRAFSGNPALKVPGRAPWSDHVFHQYTLTLQGGFREALREQLQEKGIPTMIYYPLPLHHQKAYEDARFRDEDFSITLSLCKGVVSLPMHTELDDETLAYISDLVNAISRKLFAL